MEMTYESFISFCNDMYIEPVYEGNLTNNIKNVGASFKEKIIKFVKMVKDVNGGFKSIGKVGKTVPGECNSPAFEPRGVQPCRARNKGLARRQGSLTGQTERRS